MKDHCSKCLTFDDIKEYRHEGAESYQFCTICARILGGVENTGLIRCFMHDDYKGFPISEVSQNIINARIARATGNSPWQVVAK